MAQPSFIPVPDAERVRPSIPQSIPVKARTGRPGELRSPVEHRGRGAGLPGPDQGYALALAHRLAPRLHLSVGEDRHDVERGVALLASHRASLAGRAPCSHDLDAAASLFGLLGDAPADLVVLRRSLFAGLGHSYDTQRALIDAVPDDVLATRTDTAWWRETPGQHQEGL